MSTSTITILAITNSTITITTVEIIFFHLITTSLVIRHCNVVIIAVTILYHDPRLELSWIYFATEHYTG